MVKETMFYDQLGGQAWRFRQHISKKPTGSWPSSTTWTRTVVQRLGRNLRNPEKRRIYDQHGVLGIQEGGDGGPFFSLPIDIFDMFFEGGFGGGSTPRASSHQEHHASVELVPRGYV
jgi:hypothetical protein